ncbi:hypothetical protein D9M71_721570 [compost metagenome]
MFFHKCGFITRNGASIIPPSNSILWLSIPRPGSASNIVIVCPASFRILAAARPAIPLPIIAIFKMMSHFSRIFLIITHTLKKHRIKNYQIFIFYINLYTKYLVSYPSLFLYFLTKPNKHIKPYIL